jgi:hypothetical protein
MDGGKPLMKARYMVILLLVVGLGVFTIAQGGGDLKFGRSLKIPTNPLVENHHWKNCELKNQDANFNIQARHNNNTRTIVWKGDIYFGNRTDNCKANMGRHKIEYGPRINGSTAMYRDVRKAYLKEYRKEYVPKPGLNQRGNFSK